MNDLQALRASDRDRQEVVDVLRAALEDGRLTMDEYMDRMGRAYQAVTYGDLASLGADLPASGAMSGRTTARGAADAAIADRRQVLPRSASTQVGKFLGSLPTGLKVLWSIWFMAVSINVVVWALVSLGSHHFAYPWPLWVAGPYGAALFAMSAGYRGMRCGMKGAGR